ncbi:GH36-type glycosyl hydrolase domain-containing protein [Candidatus Nitronereus thalassa]|uniref:Glucoamylase family protein n=1 Tax=Candidatus Nitronereus thalassa TaxID=3020898 RepID=A0ABU3K792_9BACT|nr:glucoamylase family protein [Candidatus Nitronereus thalassa]MDT7042203.1 glucoamylase family protein [Candidatus Nitronereus thalassa]
MLRSEILSIEQLKRHAVSLAAQHRIDPRPGPDRLLSRLADNESVLLAAYDVVTAAATPGERIGPAETWLLDNFYLIEQQIVQARRHLPRGYSRQLPRLADGLSAGFPRIYNLALELISHMDGRVDSDNATQFVAAYQTAEPLQLGELWAFPIMLQLALLENLRRIGLRIARRREERDAAIAWATRMHTTAESEPKKLVQLLAEFANADVPLTAPFVEEFYARLEALGPPMAFIQTWVEQKLLEQGVTATQLSEAAGRTAATNQISFANSIGSLHFIGALDWRNFVESLSVVEQTLREDPTEMHSIQDFSTRDRYRHVIEDVARSSSRSELAVAREAIVLAQAAAARLSTHDRTAHVGYYLIDQGRPLLERAVGCGVSWKFRANQASLQFRLFLYLGPILLLTALVTSIVLFSFDGFDLGNWQFWFLGMAGIIGGSAMAVSLVNLLVTLLLTPRALPRLDFPQGIPFVHRTMVVVPTLLSRPQEIDDLLEALEIRYLGNRDPHLFFALLTDFRDAPERTLPDDDALLARAREGIQALNETYREDRPCIFYLFHRPRVWNPYERVWMGYERKRGKLEQFNALLRGGEQTAFSDIVGDSSILDSIQYVITLDTDTQLPRDTARTLIGNLAHPLNRPVYDPDKGRIVEGYAILQPRTSISLTSAGQSQFAKLFAGESGIDPYTREVSDVYQDIFGEGSFIGKGIYDVDAFRQAVDGRFPENLILSHDLLESGYARSALVTDVDIIEEHPASYAIEASRRHRWIRGDWQIAGWLLPHVPGPPRSNQSIEPNGSKAKRQPNPLTPLSVWKIFDNLRRSLVPPSLLALLAGGWLFAQGSAWIWTLLVASVVFLPPLLGTAIEFIRKPEERDWLVHLILKSKSAGGPIMLALLTLVFLPYDTLISLNAILGSGMRMLFTRRGLLIWHMRSYATRNARHTLAGFYIEMWIAPVLAVVLAFALGWGNRSEEWLFCAPLLLLWLASPGVAWRISMPIMSPTPGLTVDQLAFLRASARRTWRFFAKFVGPQDHWLPPDNFQEYPAAGIASRTSPTNMGMSLLANLAAYDFGYLSAGEFLRRTDHTLATMEKLERYRGHFYNWYDTRTLKPLRPLYVSSVDSGNLAGSLLTLQAGLAELKDQPVLSSCPFRGLQDTLQVLADHVPSLPAPDLAKKIKLLQDNLHTLTLNGEPTTLAAADRLLDEIHRTAGELVSWLPADSDIDGELYHWAQAFDQQSRALREDLRWLVPEPQYVSNIPTLAELARERALGTETLSSAGKAPSPVSHYTGAVERLKIIDDLVERCRELAVMDFEFLYDSSCGLLNIGYDVGERRRDPSWYDLLASEARLASFLLIAQGQVPQKHWFLLGRQLTSYGGDVSLISWSGSMFEYLMPQLIMPSHENTLLGKTCKAAVSRQIEYGRQRMVPWGISESCYNATDMHHVYQYRAFGVPGLGFKRGLGDDLVIAPYASALALTVMPREACRNLQTLAANGFRGMYGFYEAVDYTPSRVPRGKDHAIVRTFMAHHQGMSLLAFAHVLLDRPMQRRFMSAPLVQATELLLQERVPKKGATLHPHAAEVSAAARPPAVEAASIMRVFTDPNTPTPEVHLLSNGRYHVMATNSGGGYSQWGDLAITRWREDATSDCWGTFIYLRDRDSGRFWSTAYQPTLRKADHYEAIFVQARAEFRRRDQGIEAHTEITVSPEDDVEIRRVTLTNLSSRTRHIEITSYAEVVLAPFNADLAHRSFSNLFVQTEILPDRQAILCRRRSRTPGEQGMWMFHLLAAPGARADEPSYETDRAQFLGRGRTAFNPVVLDRRASPSTLSNTDGSVLDPIVAIRRTVTLSPDESANVQIISGIAGTREAALELLEKYCDRHFVERAFEMAWFQSQEVLRYLNNATEAEAQVYGRLATSVIFASAWRRATPSVIARNQLGQSGLWRFVVSGDLPIVLLRVGDRSRIDLVKQVLQAHAYWRMKGLTTDLVIVNEDFSGYRAILQDQIMGLINAGPEAQVIDRPGGVFVRRAEELSEEDRVLFQTVARVILTDSAETLLEQVERPLPVERLPDRLKPLLEPAAEPSQPLAARERLFFNGLGGFTPDGREYVITLEPGQSTPAPWVNVIASPHIGTVVSESGSAYTWVENAHEFRLTTWHNDPLGDGSGEALYIRDEETGAFWSPTPLPTHGRSGYVCRHGFGYSIFEHDEAGISSELFTYVAMDAPVKFAVVKLRNHSKRSRRLSLTGYWELVLGEWRHTNLMHIVTEIDPHSGALFARNAYSRECANRVVFGQISEREHTVTGNRTEFIGRNGSLASPAAMGRTRLSGKTGAGLDPCGAIQAKIELADGEEREIVFVFGAAHNNDEARHFIQRFSGPAGATQALEGVWEHWNRTLGVVHVETPDPALNVLANGWLVYQTLSCRFWGRSGYYQSGGAYGFRDQLQDTMALIHATPWLAREQLLRCADRQFLQGDVQHWWHPPNGQGVRTHFSDDYLWLPYAACRYVLATGDTGVLDESVHFLEGRELKPEEEAYYDQPQRSTEVASLYEHCVRAIKHGLRFGEHQLPLMGCGDWNDGMNLVGRDGKGESVWLAWFLYENLELFASLARGRGDKAFADMCIGQALVLRKNIEANAWDGGWYRRAYFDDGTPLGSSQNEECQIDSISQSWAVISGGGDPLRIQQAMAAVDTRLIRRDARIIQLLAPPFDTSDLEPGYIKGYVPGVRENGGQYTHAAIWTTMAFAMMGDRERAWEMFAMLNPINHGSQPEEIERYKVEPYVMCADIYGAPPHTSRGGWTWYTGAAGWMYRLTVETLLGLQLEVDHLRIAPCVPAHWESYKIHYRFRETFYHITIKRVGEKSEQVIRVTVDGAVVDVVSNDGTARPQGMIPLTDDRQEHYVEVELS